MEATGDNYNIRFFDLVHEAVFAVDPSGPAADELEP